MISFLFVQTRTVFFLISVIKKMFNYAYYLLYYSCFIANQITRPRQWQDYKKNKQIEYKKNIVK